MNFFFFFVLLLQSAGKIILVLCFNQTPEGKDEIKSKLSTEEKYFATPTSLNL